MKEKDRHTEILAEAQGDERCAVSAPESKEQGKKGFFAIRIFNYRLVTLMIMCIIMSFIGFVVENIFRLARDGMINSRRQILPFLFAYGIAVFVMYVVLGTPKEMRFFCWKLFKKDSKLSSAAKYTLYALILFAFIFFGEVLFGTFVEWVSGIVLWDYTGIPLRFTKYTSVPTALGLTAGIMLFMRFVRKTFKLRGKTVFLLDRGKDIRAFKLRPVRRDNSHICMLAQQRYRLCNFFLVARMRKDDAACIFHLIEEKFAEIFQIHLAEIKRIVVACLHTAISSLAAILTYNKVSVAMVGHLLFYRLV